MLDEAQFLFQLSVIVWDEMAFVFFLVHVSCILSGFVQRNNIKARIVIRLVICGIIVSYVIVIALYGCGCVLC
jgi:hypothetical protein